MIKDEPVHYNKCTNLALVALHINLHNDSVRIHHTQHVLHSDGLNRGLHSVDKSRYLGDHSVRECDCSTYIGSIGTPLLKLVQSQHFCTARVEHRAARYQGVVRRVHIAKVRRCGL